MPVSTKKPNRVIDLSGPEGNAFVLLGIVDDVLKQTKHSPVSIKMILDEMKSSDYNNLVATFLSIVEPYFDIRMSEELWEKVEPLYLEKMGETVSTKKDKKMKM